MGGRPTHALLKTKNTLDLQTDKGHAYRAALSKMTSPALIGEFVGMDRALLYMPRIGLKVKE